MLRPEGNEVYCNNLILLKCTVCIIQQALPRAWSIYLRWKILKSRDAKGLKCYVCFCDGLYWSTTLWSIIVLSPHKEGINYKCCMQQGHALTKCRISHFSQLKIFSPVVQVLYSRLFASLTLHLSIENFGHILAEQINPAKIFFKENLISFTLENSE